jgi:hypothetical protein
MTGRGKKAFFFEKKEPKKLLGMAPSEDGKARARFVKASAFFENETRLSLRGTQQHHG